MRDINDVIADNVGLIRKQLHRFHLSNDAEAESIGYWALYRAASTFENDKNVLFSTYATVCIYNALGTYVRDLNKKRQLEISSYNDTKYETEEVIDFIQGSESAEDDCISSAYVYYITCSVCQERNKLTNPKVGRIVDVWVASDYSKDTKEIAKEVGVSQSYVSQVLNRFRYNLRKRLEEYNE